MPGKQQIGTVFSLQPGVSIPCVNIVANTESARLDFTLKFIFHHVLRINYKISRAPGPEDRFLIYYGNATSGTFRMVPSGIISSSEIPSKPELISMNGRSYLYPATPGNEPAFHFDIFSAVFFMISRAEEWLNYKKDKHGRFEVWESKLFKHGLHCVPVVDLWIREFSKALQEHYPDLKLPPPEFKVVSTIDVDNLYAFRSKGLLRTLGGAAKDLIKLDMKNLGRRISVVLGRKKDPFDIYENISAFCLKSNIPLFCFFLLRTGTKYDRSVNPQSEEFEKVIGMLEKNGCLNGLHPSYETSDNEDLLKREMKFFMKKSGRPARLSRQHYLRFDVRRTPAMLLRNGITADFSMGFASSPGFRAGTSHPFYYFDFNENRSKNILLVPFCAMDGAFTVYSKTGPGEALNSLLKLADEVKKTGGYFTTVFHERSFSDHLYPGFDSLYKKLHSALSGLQQE